MLCRRGPPGDGEALRKTSRAGGADVIAMKLRLAEPVRARASRFTTTGRRAPCRSGEKTNVSSDENGERDLVSGPSSLDRLSADAAAWRRRVLDSMIF